MRSRLAPFLVSLSVMAFATVVSVAAVRRASAGMLEAARAGEERGAAAQAATLGHSRRSAIEPPDRTAEWQRESDELSTEIAALRQRLAAPAGRPSLNRAALARAGGESGVWKNQGRAFPGAAFETVLWAIESGDVEALEAAITLEHGAQEAASILFADLDAESQAEFRSAAHLVAAIMAAKSRADLNGAQVLGETTEADGASVLRLRITGAHMQPRAITLRFQPGADGWRLVVPAKIITGYRNLLFGPPIDPRTYQVLR